MIGFLFSQLRLSRVILNVLLALSLCITIVLLLFRQNRFGLVGNVSCLLLLVLRLLWYYILYTLFGISFVLFLGRIVCRGHINAFLEISQFSR